MQEADIVTESSALSVVLDEVIEMVHLKLRELRVEVPTCNLSQGLTKLEVNLKWQRALDVQRYLLG